MVWKAQFFIGVFVVVWCVTFDDEIDASTNGSGEVQSQGAQDMASGGVNWCNGFKMQASMQTGKCRWVRGGGRGGSM